MLPIPPCNCILRPTQWKKKTVVDQDWDRGHFSFSSFGLTQAGYAQGPKEQRFAMIISWAFFWAWDPAEFWGLTVSHPANQQNTMMEGCTVKNVFANREFYRLYQGLSPAISGKKVVPCYTENFHPLNQDTHSTFTQCRGIFPDLSTSPGSADISCHSSSSRALSTIKPFCFA